jgi:PAS domain-containing protein
MHERAARRAARSAFEPVQTANTATRLRAVRGYPHAVDVKIHAFPSRDREFLEFAQAAFNVLAEPRTIEALQRALRVRYPAAVVTEQAELARHGEGPIVWYAFRTAAIGAPAIGDAGDTDAWAIVDDDRRFVEVSPAFAMIVELPSRRIVGHHIEDFSNPDDPTIRDDIARLWSEFKDGGALASTVRFNFADGRPREVAYRLAADDDGPGRHRLSIKVISPAP